MVSALLYHCGSSLSGIGGVARPGIVHRIDRDTTGLIAAAKNDRTHLALAAQLADHSMRREYQALVIGGIEEEGTVNAPIGRSPRDRKKMAVLPRGTSGVREAVTHYFPVTDFGSFSHIRLVLETGRTHQIRVHMAHIGHPILGDTVYGSKKAVPGLTGQCLHAVGLRFIHPRSGELVELSCPLPQEFETYLKKLKNR
jgi:23S rRNA pseudouridine1911/1915/1917 synthase